MINRLASPSLFVICLVMLVVALAPVLTSCESNVGTPPPQYGDAKTLWDSTKDIADTKISHANLIGSIKSTVITAFDGHDYTVFWAGGNGGDGAFSTVHSPDCRKCAARTMLYDSQVDTIQYMRVVFRVASPDSDSVHVKMCRPERWKQIMEIRDHR